MIVLELSAHTTSTLLLTSTRATCPTEGCGHKSSSSASFLSQAVQCRAGSSGETAVPHAGGLQTCTLLKNACCLAREPAAAEVTGVLRSHGQGEKNPMCRVSMRKPVTLPRRCGRLLPMAEDPQKAGLAAEFQNFHQDQSCGRPKGQQPGVSARKRPGSPLEQAAL